MYLPTISKNNPEFISIKSANGSFTEIRIDDINFIRLQKNKKIEGKYVLIIMFNKEVKERVEFFNSYRDASDALDCFESIIGVENVFKYESFNSEDEKGLFIKDDVVSISIDKDNRRIGYIAHITVIGLKLSQDEKFRSEEAAKDFLARALSN